MSRGTARAQRGGVRRLPPLLVDDGAGFGRDDVLPGGHVGLDVLDGELVEEFLSAERRPGRRGCRVVRLGLVDDVVEVHLLELRLARVLLEDVGRSELEDRSEFLLGVVVRAGGRRRLA